MQEDQDMRDRLTRLETTQEHLVQVQDRVEMTLDKMRRVLTLNEGNRRRIEDMDDRMTDLEAYLQSRWYVMVTVVSVVAALISIAFNLL